MAKKSKIEFYPLDVEYDNKGVISLFGRTKTGKKIIIRDKSFHFYFWVLHDDIEYIKKKLEYATLDNSNYEVVKTEVYRKNFMDKEVTALKVYVNHPGAVKEIKQELDDVTIMEADISLGKKYLIDKGITPLSLCTAEGYLSNVKGVDILDHAKILDNKDEFIDNLKLLSIDIEVYGRDMSEDKAVNDPIITIGMKGEDFERVLTWRDFNGKQEYVEVLENESEMLKRFVKLFKEYSPDYVLGYYSDGFDFPYIKARADILNVNLNLGVDNSKLKVRRGVNNKASINGIPHIDVFRFIKVIMGGSLQLDNYDLDSVSKELLNENKKDMNLDDINRSWDETDLKKLVEYNLHDTYLTLKLFKKIEQNFHELVRLIGINPFDICRLSYGQLVENYLIKRANEFNEIIQKKPGNHDITERRFMTYQGGFVMEPKPGLYDNIVMLDFRSLYPSIIISKNISPSSLNKKTGNKIEILKDNKKIIYYFDDKKLSFIPSVLKEIIIRRTRIKEILKKEKNDPVLEAMSYALKILGNSAYGMFGF